MRLSKLYSNKEMIFKPITFKNGLNVIYGEIEDIHKKDKDSHCLGKTKLAELIDFCLLKEKSGDNLFLLKNAEIFEDFEFFLEIETHEGKFLTVRRTVNENSKISIKFQHKKHQNQVYLISKEEWTHYKVPIKRAKQILDGLLGLSSINPWSYRMPVSYALRTQDDFSDVFRTKRYTRSRDKAWKPYLAKVLGINDSIVIEGYDLTVELEELERRLSDLQFKLKDFEGGKDELKGRIYILEGDIKELQGEIEKFDFYMAEAGVNKELVETIDSQISVLNESRYYLSSNIKKLKSALEKNKIIFNPKQAEALFIEAGIVFNSQITKEFEDLISFNKAITEERIKYLKEELTDSEKELNSIVTELKSLSSQRKDALIFLNKSKSIDKYKALNKKVIQHTANKESLNHYLLDFEAKESIETDIENKEGRKREIQKDLKASIDILSSDEYSLYSVIRNNFNQITRKVLAKSANIFMSLNTKGNLNFGEEIFGDSGKKTSEDDGFTYKKILCIIFDLSINKAFSKKAFSHFMYHDGALDTLDDRKKINLIEQLRELENEEVQSIITVIESELPRNADGTDFSFEADEIILKLDDSGKEGRLFKMESW